MRISKDIQMVSPVDMCNYILSKYGAMSHLKIQKLLYYSQAYHLAYFKKPLFKEDFEAWVHGPVCRDVFNIIKNTSVLYNDVNFTGDKDRAIAKVERNLNSGQKEVLEEVLLELSSWTGLELEAATHNEAPWKEARNGLDPGAPSNSVISKNTMMEYFTKEINGI